MCCSRKTLTQMKDIYKCLLQQECNVKRRKKGNNLNILIQWNTINQQVEMNTQGLHLLAWINPTKIMLNKKASFRRIKPFYINLKNMQKDTSCWDTYSSNKTRKKCMRTINSKTKTVVTFREEGEQCN